MLHSWASSSSIHLNAADVWKKAILEANQISDSAEIGKRKVGPFCETRWTEKHTVLANVEEMYIPLITCFDAMASVESDWDSKTSTAAYGLLKNITDHAFIVAFQIVRHFFRYVQGLSSKLQGSTLDVIQGYEMVSNVTGIPVSYTHLTLPTIYSV